MAFNEKPGSGRKVGIVGVPLGFGAGQTGSQLGVQAMKLSHFRGEMLIDHIKGLGFDVSDYGNVEIVEPKETIENPDNPLHLGEMGDSCLRIQEQLDRVLNDGALPVILGGDHSIAIGTFSAVASHYRKKDQDIGLIWFDAHADINTPETSRSGNIHGMPLAVLLGYGADELVDLGGYAPKLKPEYCAHVGARDLDAGEKRRVHEFGLRDNFFTMSDID